MAERLADQASGSTGHLADFAPHLEVVEQFGVRMRSFERNGRMRVCYDGELFHRVLTLPAAQPGPLTLSLAPGSPGQTCITLEDAHRPRAGALIRRCTYGIVRLASIQAILQGPALVLAVQPLEGWRELWVFHERAGSWTIDVLSPGLDNPEEGYVDFAGYAPGTRRLLIAREVKDRGRFRRSFEELRLDDLALVRQASSPELLRDFGRWQDVVWRRDTLALH